MTTKQNKPWYDEAFGEDYLQRYAHRDEQEARAAVALFVAHLPEEEGVVFDLCCGAGRHLAELRAQGVAPVVGLDRSASLLRVARRSHLSVVRGDMARLPFLDRSLRAVTNFFTSFGYFEEDEDNERVIREVARCLSPGGVFCIDFLNTALLRVELHWLEVCRQEGIADPRDTRRLSPDGKRVLKKITRDGVAIEESVRLFSKEELWAMCNRSGLLVKHCFGGYHGEPYDEETSLRTIMIAERL